MSDASHRDPLYYQARQHILYANDVGIAHLQRRLRIGYQHAVSLREALIGDAVEYRAETDSWHIRLDVDRSTDFLLRDKMARAAELIQNAKGLVIAAGAGMSIDSGLPNFRGEDGFWRAYPALSQQRLNFESIASPQAFRRSPATAWGFYGHRLKLYRSAQPHTGFDLLQAWSQGMQQGCFVFTSNVDGHFQKAGIPATRVYECHGSIHRLQCTANCGHLWSAADFYPQVDEAACKLQSALPLCPHCGALARPNILLFNDLSWNDLLADRQQMQLDAWLDKSPAPLVLEIGAGRAIPTVRNFSQRMQQSGSKLIRINPHDVNIHNSQAIEIAMGAKQALEAIEQYLTS